MHKQNAIILVVLIVIIAVALRWTPSALVADRAPIPEEISVDTTQPVSKGGRHAIVSDDTASFIQVDCCLPDSMVLPDELPVTVQHSGQQDSTLQSGCFVVETSAASVSRPRSLTFSVDGQYSGEAVVTHDHRCGVSYFAEDNVPTHETRCLAPSQAPDTADWSLEIITPRLQALTSGLDRPVAIEAYIEAGELVVQGDGAGRIAVRPTLPRRGRVFRGPALTVDWDGGDCTVEPFEYGYVLVHIENTLGRTVTLTGCVGTHTTEDGTIGILVPSDTPCALYASRADGQVVQRSEERMITVQAGAEDSLILTLPAEELGDSGFTMIGSKVMTVYPDTLAERAGIEPRDVLLSIDGEPVPPDISREEGARLVSAPIGHQRTLRFARGEHEYVVTLDYTHARP